MSRILRVAAGLLLTLTVPVAIVAMVVSLLATGPLVRLAYARPGFPSPVGMSAEVRARLAVDTTSYVAGRADRGSLEALRLPDDRPLYATGEVEHLADVRRLIGALRLAGLAAGLMLVAAWVGPWRAWAAVPTARGGWLSLGAVALLGLGIAVAWSWLFTTFHELLFPPGTWQFSADSGLIRLFPGPFWSDAAIALAGGTALLGWLLARMATRVAGPRRAMGRGSR